MHMIPIQIEKRLLHRMPQIPDRLLRSFFQMGGEIIRAEVIRQVGFRRLEHWRPILRACLRERAPSIRRNAAMSIGFMGLPRDKDFVLDYAMNERCDTVRFHLLLAARRCGGSEKEVWRVAHSYLERTMVGAYGARPTGGFASWTAEETRELWELAGGGDSAVEPLSVSLLRTQARDAIDLNPDDRSAVLRLGLAGHTADVDALGALWGTAGRRMRLTLCKSMGLHGSGLFIGRLERCLTAMDVDPGHGFALRTEAAIAIGRMGYGPSSRTLISALETEALDFEGRPGAGLGIQHSVRNHIIAALGELQKESSILRTYLGNTHGNAQGGFYLAAMDALWKYGEVKPLYPLLSETDIVAANALGVIRAVSGAAAVSQWKSDGRPMVAQVASD